MRDQSFNQALSREQRTKHQHDAKDQLEHVQELKYNLVAFERQASATLTERESLGRINLLAAISATIAIVAQAKGDSLVVDAEDLDADAA